MDVNSGSVHVVDELMYMYDAMAVGEKFIGEIEAPIKLDDQTKATKIKDALIDKYSEKEIDEAVADMGTYRCRGALYNWIPMSCISMISRRETVVKALCVCISLTIAILHVSTALRREGEYHGRRALMSYDVGKRALDFLVANSDNRKNLEVDFFGGERYSRCELAGSKRPCKVRKKS